ncbi:Chorismate synthase [Pseudocohnilembus persalinus]|uniref:chorismate synthase n=1 Tax=Pseudocohnilembus persalinus TaxID=266149 RepID=A0A0V0QSC6_PSEPJ|nr:Chorismate synthase [Pseudocohnilembus persalinus]|eukprot:KRX05214.1 Chorismate synthase [Pseudocohnilembus persalinus]
MFNNKLMKIIWWDIQYLQTLICEIGVIIEGFPSKILVEKEKIQEQLNRRRPGQSKLTTPRQEKDLVSINSGVENGFSLGTPIHMSVQNEDYIKKDYSKLIDIPRPGHADYTYYKKYGIKAESGGGRSSARETIGRVCAGSLADLYLQKQGIYITAFVSSVGKIKLSNQEIQNFSNLSREQIDEMSTFYLYQQENEQQYAMNCDNYYNLQTLEQIIQPEELEQVQKLYLDNEDKIDIVNTRCPSAKAGLQMIKLIQQVKENKDSIGGTVSCFIKGAPVGLGEPCFDKLEALLAHAMLSIPATKGFEIGSGFDGCEMLGSEHNDVFYCPEQNSDKNNKQNILNKKSPILKTKTNNHGGTLGGISSGEDIYFKVGFKPVSTIGKKQETSDINGNTQILEAKGRHDPCVLPRAPPIVESMASITIMDMFLAQKINQI